MKSLVKDRLNFHRYKKYKLFSEISKHKERFINILDSDYYETYYKNIINKQTKVSNSLKDKHKKKLNFILREQD